MEEKIICYCMNVSERTIVNAIKAGAKTLKEIQQTTNACNGTRCKELNPKGACCSGDILEIIKLETGGESQSSCCCCH